MAAARSSTALAPVQPVFTDAERLALAGYLAGYRGLTREAYTLDLRQFTGWCRTRSLPLFSVRRCRRSCWPPCAPVPPPEPCLSNMPGTYSPLVKALILGKG